MNEKPPQEEKKLSKEEAYDIVGAIAAEVAKMGANDSEIPDLNRIREELLAGKCTPKSAVQKASDIKARKMDYH